jgi:flagellar biosynthetic protein FliP
MEERGYGNVRIFLIGMIIFSILLVPAIASAKASTSKGKTESKIDVISSFTGSEGSKNLISIVLLLTILAFAPAILLLMSSFTRIVIVLSFLRQAIGIPQLPPNQIIIGLSLFLTFFIMAPTYEKVHSTAQ